VLSHYLEDGKQHLQSIDVFASSNAGHTGTVTNAAVACCHAGCLKTSSTSICSVSSSAAAQVHTYSCRRQPPPPVLLLLLTLGLALLHHQQ
jgi:hypothetical protein